MYRKKKKIFGLHPVLLVRSPVVVVEADGVCGVLVLFVFSPNAIDTAIAGGV
jgi:hypothetical protein